MVLENSLVTHNIALGEIRSLVLNLPDPAIRVSFPGLDIDVYHAKSPYTSEWKSPKLRNLVYEARKSYRAYGDVPPFDRYDDKSWIFLARAQGSAGETVINNLFSLRFVPGNQEPRRTEDLDFLECHDAKGSHMPLWDLMKARLKPLNNLSDEQALEKTITQSRFCRIPAFYSDETSEDMNVFLNPSNNAGLSFALMNKAFLQDVRMLKLPIEILTCQMHKHLSDFLLAYQVNEGQRLSLPFTQAWEVLGLPYAETVYLNRADQNVYCYKYPGYFLDIKSLSEVLKKLIMKGHLSETTLKRYFPSIPNDRNVLNKLSKLLRVDCLSQLGELLTIQGHIDDSNITGELLRTYLDFVDDGPVMRIMLMRRWEEGVDKMIKVAGGVIL